MNIKRLVLKYVKYFFVCFLSIIILVLSFLYIERHIRRTVKFDDTISAIVSYQNYACENGVRFRILKVDNSKYNDFIENELCLYSDTLDIEGYWSSCLVDSTDLVSPKFLITGKLHKYQKNLFIFGNLFEPICFCFEVSKIQFLND